MTRLRIGIPGSTNDARSFYCQSQKNPQTTRHTKQHPKPPTRQPGASHARGAARDAASPAGCGGLGSPIPAASLARPCPVPGASLARPCPASPPGSPGRAGQGRALAPHSPPRLPALARGASFAAAAQRWRSGGRGAGSSSPSLALSLRGWLWAAAAPGS